MSLQVAVELAQFEQMFYRKKSGFRPGRVKQWSRMAFGKDEPVIVVEMRVLRIIAHVSEKERGDEISGGAARSRMAAAGSRRLLDRVDPQLVGDALKCLGIDVV